MDDTARQEIIEAIVEGGRISVSAIETQTGQDHGAIQAVIQDIAGHNEVSIEEESTETPVLTEKGEKAIEDGLPEQQLLDLVVDSPRPIQDVQREIEAFDIALGVCKREQLAEITDKDGETIIKATKGGRNRQERGFELANILDSIRNGDLADIHEEVLERGLVKEEKHTETIVAIDEDAQAEGLLESLRSAGEGIGELSIDDLKSKQWKEDDITPYDVSKPVKVRHPGKRHPYRRYLDSVREKLMAMGFQEAKTDLVEMEFWNFDVLFQAQDHPAREIHDKFELADPSSGNITHDDMVERVKSTHESGWKLPSTGWEYQWSKEKASRLMLRSQTTATTIRHLAKGQPSPSKLFAIDRNFRYDEIDKTHFVEFYQAEGIVKAEDLSLSNLFGYLEVFAKEIAGADEIRFRPGYFPFTEPSVELDAFHPELGWIELGGAGLFRPEVRKPLGVTDPVIAWGMGIDRLAMFKLDKDDIRELVFPQDLDSLRSSPALVF